MVIKDDKKIIIIDTLERKIERKLLRKKLDAVTDIIHQNYYLINIFGRLLLILLYQIILTLYIRYDIMVFV